jgi:hypothetical protein
MKLTIILTQLWLTLLCVAGQDLPPELKSATKQNLNMKLSGPSEILLLTLNFKDAINVRFDVSEYYGSIITFAHKTL